MVEYDLSHLMLDVLSFEHWHGGSERRARAAAKQGTASRAISANMQSEVDWCSGQFLVQAAKVILRVTRGLGESTRLRG